MIGLTLVFGKWVRFGALVGTLWAINLLIGLANVPNEQGWYYGFLVMLNAIFLALDFLGLPTKRAQSAAEPNPA